ncbi:hypothetical protein L226DRAFT_540126, partial [Lentinus tigrinus ALCF2SS1-7]
MSQVIEVLLLSARSRHLHTIPMRPPIRRRVNTSPFTRVDHALALALAFAAVAVAASAVEAALQSCAVLVTCALVEWSPCASWLSSAGRSLARLLSQRPGGGRHMGHCCYRERVLPSLPAFTWSYLRP